MLFKVVVTPALIAAATLAGRRWGDRMSGWLVGLPLTSGPVVVFRALDHGSRFATTASLGVLLGTISRAAFAVAYACPSGSFASAPSSWSSPAASAAGVSDRPSWQRSLSPS